jgi:hypothetical protein
MVEFAAPTTAHDPLHRRHPSRPSGGIAAPSPSALDTRGTATAACAGGSGGDGLLEVLELVAGVGSPR